MKKLDIENASFRYIEQSFKEWLDVQGYAESTVYNLPLHIRELLHYLEQKEITNIKQLDVKHIQSYYQRLKERSNQRRGGGLSNAHLNTGAQEVCRIPPKSRKAANPGNPAKKRRSRIKSPLPDCR